MLESQPNFHKPIAELSVAAVAELCGGRVADGLNGSIRISGLSSLDDPRNGSLVFVQSLTSAEKLVALSKVAAVLCNEKGLAALPDGPAKIVVSSPHAAFAAIGCHLFPDSLGPGRANATDGYNPDYPDAHVSRLAQIEDGVVIGAGAVIGDHVAIGRNTIIGSNAVIADHCQIGRECRIGPLVDIQYALIGNGVILHGGARIGQDGFGYVPGPEGLQKVPQLGRVILQDRVEIGANATVDRGALDDTVIGEGTKIDNLVQIAHNVRIGRHCAIAAHTGLSGSVVIGDGCLLGGAVGIADHVTIGSGVQIAASSGVMHDIPDGERWAGTPARPYKEFFRQSAALRKLAAADKKPKNKKQQDS